MSVLGSTMRVSTPCTGKICCCKGWHTHADAPPAAHILFKKGHY